MTTPAYADLGKRARDVFGTSFNLDRGKVHLFAPLRDYWSVDAESQYLCKEQKLIASILGKLSMGSKGTLTTKFESSGLLVGEYLLNCKLGSEVDNAAINAGVSLNSSEDFKSVKVGGKYFNESAHTTLSVTKDFDRNVTLLGSLVLRVKNCFIGYQAGYDTTTSKLTKNDVALELHEPNYGAHFRCIQIPREYGLSLYHRVNEEVEVGLDAKLANANETRLWFMGMGMAWQLNERWKWRVKMDKNLQLASSMQIAMNENVFLTLSMALDLPRFTDGQHKVGFGLCVS